MATFNKFNSFVEAMAEKKHDLGSDVLKAMLTNTAPVAGDSVKTDITEITAENGYTAGGAVLDLISSSQSGGTYTLVLTDEILTASGGSFGPFRYVVLYNDTATGKELIGWYDYGSNVTTLVGETFTIDFGANTIQLS